MECNKWGWCEQWDKWGGVEQRGGVRPVVWDATVKWVESAYLGLDGEYSDSSADDGGHSKADQHDVCLVVAAIHRWKSLYKPCVIHRGYQGSKLTR